VTSGRSRVSAPRRTDVVSGRLHAVTPTTSTRRSDGIRIRRRRLDALHPLAVRTPRYSRPLCEAPRPHRLSASDRRRCPG
jgi:hypothetical protein